MVWLRWLLVLKIQKLGKLIAPGELKTRSHVSDVTVVQIITAAISLNPVLGLVQWDGRTSHLTTSRNLYSLTLAFFKWTAACKTYCAGVTALQRSKNSLSSWLAVACAISCRNSEYSWNVRAAVFKGRSCRQYVAITLYYTVWADFPASFLSTHPVGALVQMHRAFPFSIDRAEQNPSV